MAKTDTKTRILDTAERLRGSPSPEILHYRIDALRQQGDPASMRRMQADLTGLLELDQSPQTRALVAELLLDFAAQADTLAFTSRSLFSAIRLRLFSTLRPPVLFRVAARCFGRVKEIRPF